MQNEMAKMISENDDWSKIEYQYYFSSIIVEICKAIEARRESNFTDYQGYEVDESDFKDAYFRYIEGTYQDHLADAYMMILSYSGNLGIDIENRVSDVVERSLNEDVYKVFNKIISVMAKITGYEEINTEYKQFIQILVVDSLIYIESLAERSGKDIHWHVGNKIAYNSSIKNESNDNG